MPDGGRVRLLEVRDRWLLDLVPGQGRPKQSLPARSPPPRTWTWAYSAVLVPVYKSTEAAHSAVASSPFFKAQHRICGKEAIPKMESAIREKDIFRIGELAELDTLLLHGITMTGIDQLFLWRPETVKVILEVKEMRKAGLNCHFSIDTGATVYVNSPLDQLKEVQEPDRGT